MKRTTIGQLAVATATPVTTIRYYERVGLLQAARRPPGTHRVYSDGEMARLQFIRRARGLGFSVADIKALLALSERGRASCPDVERLARRHLNNVRGKIEDLRELEDRLTHYVARCSGDPQGPCAFLDQLHAQAEF